MAFHNRLRLQQATALRASIVKDGFGLKEYQVLRVLAARMAREPKPDSKEKRNPLTITDTCWPSLKTICKESLLSDSSVRRALDNLLAGDRYITKSKIAGRRLRKGKKANKYENNRYHLVPELWDAAFTPKPKEKAAAGGEIISTPPAVSAADEAFVEAIDTKPVQRDSMPASVEGKYAQTENILTLLKTHFGSHATFQLPDATRIMTSNIWDCIDIAGSGDLCLAALEWVFANEEICAKVTARAKKLGGYIVVAFRNWLAEYKADRDEVMQACIDQFCDNDLPKYQLVFTRAQLHLIKPTCDWFREKLVPHLLDLVDDDVTAARTGEEAHVITFSLSPEYRAARRLGRKPDQGAGSEAEEEEPETISSNDNEDEDAAEEYDAEEEDRLFIEHQNRRELEVQY
jgi:hypothetical protein